jgi:glutathione S-transferase
MCCHADIATFPWVNALSAFYKADDTLELASFTAVKEWLDHCMKRPASKVRVYCIHIQRAVLRQLGAHD